jgi:NAD(P)-dependent dehydrogenase (short-subunit alcohol dehydrogenase family)
VQAVWKALKVRRTLRLGALGFAFEFRRATPLRLVRGGQGLAAGTAAAPQPVPRAHGHEAADAPAAPPGVAVVVGAGPGLGEALARKLAAAGFDVALEARDGPRLAALARSLAPHGGRVASYVCDATSEGSVGDLFARLDRDLGTPSLVVYGIQGFGPGETVSVEVPAFEDSWRHNCLGAFLIARQACQRMAQAGRGSMILVGSTSSVIGRSGHLNLAVGKFGLRAMAQVLAREMWPRGVHVAHVMVDADIAAAPPAQGTQADPGDIADAIVFLHRQPRTAWSSEIDLRPWNEAFWEHC